MEYDKIGLLSFLDRFIGLAYMKRDLTEVYYKSIDSDLSLMLSWEDGFETSDGYELCVSIRKRDSDYMVAEWDYVGESVSLSESITEDTLSSILEFLFE